MSLTHVFNQKILLIMFLAASISYGCKSTSENQSNTKGLGTPAVSEALSEISAFTMESARMKYMEYETAMTTQTANILYQYLKKSDPIVEMKKCVFSDYGRNGPISEISLDSDISFQFSRNEITSKKGAHFKSAFYISSQFAKAKKPKLKLEGKRVYYTKTNPKFGGVSVLSLAAKEVKIKGESFLDIRAYSKFLPAHQTEFGPANDRVYCY